MSASSDDLLRNAGAAAEEFWRQSSVSCNHVYALQQTKNQEPSILSAGPLILDGSVEIADSVAHSSLLLLGRLSVG